MRARGAGAGHHYLIPPARLEVRQARLLRQGDEGLDEIARFHPFFLFEKEICECAVFFRRVIFLYYATHGGKERIQIGLDLLSRAAFAASLRRA